MKTEEVVRKQTTIKGWMGAGAALSYRLKLVNLSLFLLNEVAASLASVSCG